MSDRQTVWVDVQRCTGCATCVQVCPVGAIRIENNEASLDDGICTGCGACVDACPEGAIQYVIEGEIVPVRAPPVPAVRQPSPVAEAAGAVVVAGGAALLRRATNALAQAVDQWLTDRSAGSGVSPEHRPDTGAEAPPGAQRGGGGAGGHRARRRRRGR
jgi:Fe-S-cluster-containing hydrogenase component 2